MTDSKNTLLRQWTMMRHLPTYPRRLSTREIAKRLEGDGYQVSNRTVERDLQNLSLIFPYTNDTEGKTNFWFWPQESALLDLPAMPPTTALVFTMSEAYLKPILPPEASRLLDPYFQCARQTLEESSSNRLSHWPDRVRVVTRGPQLLPAKIDPKVHTTVYQALLNEKRVIIKYQGRSDEAPSERVFSPLGLASKDGVIYLIGPLWDYDNVVQLALHRIQEAEISVQDIHQPEGFSLDHYLKNELQISYPLSEDKISLVIRIDKTAGYHLLERPLAKDQTITEEEDTLLVKASVADTAELQWWLAAFGDIVEVIEPAELRGQFTAMSENLYETYREL